MGEVPSATNIYKNLDFLAGERTRGKILDPLDEQRLRDHQLRRLRRIWLKDQLLTAREPVLPQKKGFLARWRAAEENFWSKHLKFRNFKEYLYHGKDYHQLPLLLFYKFQSNVRFFYLFTVLPILPIYYHFKYGEFRVPSLTYRWPTPVYPGDKSFDVPYGEYKRDPKTGGWRKPETEN